jgi:hypothetical protein
MSLAFIRMSLALIKHRRRGAEPPAEPPQSQILNIIIKAQRTQINITTGIRVMTAAARNGVRTAAAHRETIATGETMAEDGLG